MINNKKMSKGITLIALVVTIIVLLILAGISVQMLTGDNGILTKTGQAKKKTYVESVKEQIQLKAFESLDENGKINKEQLKTNLEKIGATVRGEDFPIAVILNGLNYEVNDQGVVKKVAPTLMATLKNVKIVNSSGTEVATNSTDPSITPLFINFEVSLAEGQVTSVTHKGVNVTATNGIYSQEVSANGNYDFTINGSLDGENVSDTKQIIVNQFAVRKGIKVGDYIKYIPEKDTNNNVKKYSKQNLTEQYTGNTSDSYNNIDLTQETLKWRVLKIYEDGKMKLIGDPTTQKVRLYGATGYNNGVWILNDICEQLYSRKSDGMIARSMCLEDFEDDSYYVNSSKGNWKENKNNSINNLINTMNTKFNNGSSYIEDVNLEEHTITWVNGRSYYPNLYALENGSGIDTKFVKEDGVFVSDKIATSILDLNEKTGGNLKKHANTNLTTKVTFYRMQIAEKYYGDAWKTLCASPNNATIKNWVASRYVTARSRKC